MSILIPLFWTSLLLPGWAIARRLDPRGVAQGLGSAIALSFLASLAVLALAALPGYLVGAPLELLSAATVGLVAWGAVDLLRHDRGRAVLRLLLGALGLELALLLASAVVAARVGSPLGADAVVHAGRVRFLMDHGLSNLDHFVAEPFFYPIYHTNVLHALVGVSAQVTGTDHLAAWYAALAPMQMLVACGAWHAGRAIFRSDAAAWATALFVLGHRGAVTFLVYPNQVAPWLLVPLLAASLVRALDGEGRGPTLAVAATALAIGMTHGMYAVFVAMAAGPVVAVIAARRLLRGDADRRTPVACGAALALALVFPAVSVLATRSAAAKRPDGAAVVARAAIDAESIDGTDDARGSAPRSDATGPSGAEREGAERAPKLSSLFLELEGGWVMHRFGRGFTGGRGRRVVELAVAVVLAVLAGRRRTIVPPLAMLLVVAAWLHVPPLCTLLVRVAGTEWMVHRFAALQDVLHALVVPGSLAAWVGGLLARRPVVRGAAQRPAAIALRGAYALLCLRLGAFEAHLRAPYDWPTVLDRAEEPAASRHGRQLRPLRRFGEDLAGLVPPGSVVLAEPSIGAEVVMVHDCRIVASDSSSVGVPALRSRTLDVRRMLREGTPAEDRERLLAEYGVTHLVVARPAPRWTVDRMSAFVLTEFDRGIISLRQPGDESEVRGDYERALLDAGRAEEAIAWLERKVAANPGDFGPAFRLGRTLAGADRHAEALDAFRIAHRARPDDPRAAIMIGNELSELGRLEEAILAYEETARIATRTGDGRALASALYNTGNMHFRRADWPAAVDAYRRALQANPRHVAAADWLAEALRREAASREAEVTPP